MYIFLSADSKIAYLYDFCLLIDYFWYQKYVDRNTSRRRKWAAVQTNWNQPGNRLNKKKKGYKKQNGEKKF